MSTLSKLTVTGIALSLLGGCMSLSGYGGSKQFRCSNRLGGQVDDPYCTSISDNYNASFSAGNTVPTRHTAEGVATLQRTRAYDSGTPVRSQTDTARIWIAPYQDTDGDLVDQSFVYVVLKQGDWLIDHNRQQIIDEYRPVRLLGSHQPDEQAAAESNTTGNDTKNDRIPDVGTTMSLHPANVMPDTGMQ